MIIVRRTCDFCLSSTALDGPCRNCGLTFEEARQEALNEILDNEGND